MSMRGGSIKRCATRIAQSPRLDTKTSFMSVVKPVERWAENGEALSVDDMLLMETDLDI